MLFRHDPVGLGGLQRPPNDHVPIAAVVFYVIQGAALATGIIRSRTRSSADGRLVLTSAAFIFVFLLLVQPLAEAANACYVGQGFLLRPSC